MVTIPGVSRYADSGIMALPSYSDMSFILFLRFAVTSQRESGFIINSKPREAIALEAAMTPLNPNTELL